VVWSQEPEDAAILDTLAIMRSSGAIWELAFGIQGSRLMWDIIGSYPVSGPGVGQGRLKPGSDCSESPNQTASIAGRNFSAEDAKCDVVETAFA
jgi:hypothetical protein